MFLIKFLNITKILIYKQSENWRKSHVLQFLNQFLDALRASGTLRLQSFFSDSSFTQITGLNTRHSWIIASYWPTEITQLLSFHRQNLAEKIICLPEKPDNKNKVLMHSADILIWFLEMKRKIL